MARNSSKLACFIFLLCVCRCKSTQVDFGNESSTVDFPFPSLRPWMGIALAGPDNGSYNDCVKDSQQLKAGFEKKLLWATRMVDASVRTAAGVLWGSRYQFGSFDGCMSAGATAPLSGVRYCLVKMTVNHNTDRPPPGRPWSHEMELGPEEDARAVLSGVNQLEGYFRPGEVLVAQCVPRSCSPADVEVAARTVLATSPAAPDISVEPQFCTDDLEAFPSKTIYNYIFWCFAWGITAFTFAAPFFGWSWWNWRDHVRSLSLPDPPLDGMDLTALSGIRFFNSVLVTMGHRALVAIAGPTSNQVLTEPDLLLPERMITFNGHTYINTFLFFSGLLFVVGNKQYSVRKLTFTRILRFSPSILVVIAFIVFGIPTMSNGPLWKYLIGRESEACTRWWWTNFLFITNYFGASDDRGCMSQSWYLSLDLQLLVLFTLLRPRQRSLSTLLLVLVMAAAVPIVLTYLNGWPAIVFRGPMDLQNFLASHLFVNVYTPTHMQTAPYVVGLIAGNQFLQLQRRSFRLSARATGIITWVSLLVLLACFMSTMLMLRPYVVHPAVLEALYAGFMPVIWAAALGMLSVALVFGESTIIRDLLTWQPVVTLSRLGYGVYLVNFILPTSLVAEQRDPKELSPISVTTDWFSDLVFCWLLSFWLYLTVEAPARKITKAILDRVFPKNVSAHVTPTGIESTLKNTGTKRTKSGKEMGIKTS